MNEVVGSLVEQITRELDTDATVGLILTGSHVRGDETPYSDVDFDRFVEHDPSPLLTGPMLS